MMPKGSAHRRKQKWKKMMDQQNETKNFVVIRSESWCRYLKFANSNLIAAGHLPGNCVHCCRNIANEAKNGRKNYEVKKEPEMPLSVTLNHITHYLQNRKLWVGPIGQVHWLDVLYHFID